MDQAKDWRKVARTSEIGEAGPIAVRVGNRMIALYRIAGAYYATDAICSHEFAELADGMLDVEGTFERYDVVLDRWTATATVSPGSDRYDLALAAVDV